MRKAMYYNKGREARELWKHWEDCETWGSRKLLQAPLRSLLCIMNRKPA